jgi:hypothetical protein
VASLVVVIAWNMFLSNAKIKAKYLTPSVLYLNAFRYQIRLKSDKTGRRAEGGHLLAFGVFNEYLYNVI